MFDRVAGWELGVILRKTNLFKGFATGSLEGRFVESVGFSAGESGLSCVCVCGKEGSIFWR